MLHSFSLVRLFNHKCGGWCVKIQSRPHRRLLLVYMNKHPPPKKKAQGGSVNATHPVCAGGVLTLQMVTCGGR